MDSDIIINHLLEEGVLTRQTITRAVKETLREYIKAGQVKCAYDVGSGQCENFVEAVLSKMGNPNGLDAIWYAELTGKIGCDVCDEIFYPETLVKFKVKLPEGVTVDLLNKSELGSGGSHVFLRWDAPQGYLYFDAESPQGVDSPFSLAFAQRYLNIARLHNWK